jgi:hypothetical protein
VRNHSAIKLSSKVWHLMGRGKNIIFEGREEKKMVLDKYIDP